MVRCLASPDQLQAAQRDLNEAAVALGEFACPEGYKPATELDISPSDAKLNANIAKLSDREFEVFALIGGGLTCRQIAKRLHVAASTVETYRERLKSKLELGTGSALVRTATIWALSQRLANSDNDA